MSTLEDQELRRRIAAVIERKGADGLSETIDPHKCGIGAFETQENSADQSPEDGEDSSAS